MGGNAFAHASSGSAPTLHTPRMTPEKYAEFKAMYEKKLRDCLPDRKISILKEAPEKSSYGDLDFFVQSTETPIDWKALAKQLGAAGLIVHSNGKVQSCSLAVPMDGSSSPDLIVYKIEKTANKAPENVTMEDYAQLDFEVVPQELFEWHAFYASYGDMSGLLGHMVHNLGFTMCDRGLMLRLAALDAVYGMAHLNVPQKSGRLFLSRDPQQVLQFLGLSYDAYERGFETVDEFYEWLGQCTLLSKDSVKIKRDDASARQKEKRPLYSNFYNIWLPAHLGIEVNEQDDIGNTPSTPDNSVKRQDLLEKAVKFFDKRAEYEQMNAALIRTIESQSVDHLLRPMVIEHSGLVRAKVAEILRGFRRWVGFRDGSPCILSTPHSDDQTEMHNFLDDADKMVLRDEEGVSMWVKQHWEQVKQLERGRAETAARPV